MARNEYNRQYYAQRKSIELPSHDVIRACVVCGERFPHTVEYFIKHPFYKYGVGKTCKECNRRQRRKHHD